MHIPVWRYYLVLGACLSMFAGLGVRAAWIQVIDNDFLKSQGENRTVRYQGITSHRGIITDRNGVELASSIPIKSLWVNPSRLFEEQEKYTDFFETTAWAQLASLVDMSVMELNSWLGDPRRNKKQRVWLKRQLEPSRSAIIRRLKIPGINLEQESRRYYPTAEVTAHLVGFTDIDEKGISGIEKAYDERLQSENGRRKIIKDRKGNPIEQVDIIETAQSGEDLALSIDIRIQTSAYQYLKAAVKRVNAKAGSVVVLDIDTGEVLAMANQPSYNPNNNKTRVANSTRNRAMTDVFEPGSTVKPLTAISALTSGKYYSNSKIDTSPGLIRVGGRWVRDGRNHGVMSVSDVIKKSSNVGVTRIALNLTDDEFLESFYKVGFGVDNATGFPGESTGHLNIRKNWSAIEKATLSFGYGLDVSALQLAKAYAVLGGLGTSRPVSLLKVQGPIVGQQVIDPYIARQVIGMMEQVVTTGGTGKKAQVAGYRVSGKTGTSRKTIVGVGGYGDDYFAVFAGVAPVRNPRLAIVVVIDDPQGDAYYGGDVAAPVFAEVMEHALRTLNIAPDVTDKKELIVASLEKNYD
ncbi:MAG: peptidoglycan glycosyltransferase FtsI [Gammaproteobacteria bacterium]|nr:MAG: peptidoglycan glycosyltransferase FtsI [Gammaproteobacteria bacterium]